MKKFWFILIILWIILMIYRCGSCSSKNNGNNQMEKSPTNTENSSSTSSLDIPQWLIGDWYCTTPYGTMHVCFYKDGTCIDSFDGAGTYEFRGDEIAIRYLKQSVSTTIKVHGHSLEAGDGYYYSKR